MRHHGAQNKAPRIQSGDDVRSARCIHIAVNKSVDQNPKDFGVLEQGSDISKLHARRGPIGHGANMGAKVIGDAGVLHRGLLCLCTGNRGQVLFGEG